MANLSLQRASREKNDEFYTQLADIEQELRHYKEHFRDKIVFCNCDDPFESNFVKYFAMNFNYLGLKKLIATCYDSSPIAFEQQSLFEEVAARRFSNTVRHAYKIEINQVDDYNKDGAIDLTDVRHLLLNKGNTLTLMQGNGDFRSRECIDLLLQADIICTNPPFSLFREYVAQLVHNEKKFLIIGNQNAITYKEIFPLIQRNKLWLGYNSGAQEFQVPMSFERNNTFIKNGVKYAKFGNICWFTNLDIKKRHENLILYKKYSPEEYPKYDNYDAINVDKVADIPCDYFPTPNCSGEMGVPITFLEKYNPEQFELRKFRKGIDEKDLTYTIEQGNISQTDRQTDRPELRHISGSSFVARCNGVMGVPITFIDKYNPEQFELIGATESEGKGFSAGLWSESSGVAQAIVAGRRKYKRLFIKFRM